MLGRFFRLTTRSCQDRRPESCERLPSGVFRRRIASLPKNKPSLAAIDDLHIETRAS